MHEKSVRNYWSFGAAALIISGVVTAVAYARHTSNATFPTQDFQTVALSDGRVTMDEVEVANENYRLCLNGAGVGARLAYASDRLRPPYLEISIAASDGIPDRESVNAGQDAISRCMAANYGAIMDAYYRQLEPTRDDLIALYDGLRACVAEGGFKSGNLPDGMDYVSYLNPPAENIRISAAESDAYRECAWEFQARTGLFAPEPILSAQ